MFVNPDASNAPIMQPGNPNSCMHNVPSQHDLQVAVLTRSGLKGFKARGEKSFKASAAGAPAQSRPFLGASTRISRSLGYLESRGLSM